MKELPYSTWNAVKVQTVIGNHLKSLWGDISQVFIGVPSGIADEWLSLAGLSWDYDPYRAQQGLFPPLTFPLLSVPLLSFSFFVYSEFYHADEWI